MAFATTPLRNVTTSAAVLGMSFRRKCVSVFDSKLTSSALVASSAFLACSACSAMMAFSAIFAVSALLACTASLTDLSP